MDLKTYEPMIRRLAHKYRNLGEVDDLMQMAWVAVLVALESIDQDDPRIENCILVTARNAILNHARDSKRMKRSAPGGPMASLDHHELSDGGGTLHEVVPGGEQPVASLDIFVALGALAELKGKERDVMAMRYVHGLDVSEAATALGMSGQYVREVERRALDRLRKRLR